MGPRLHTANAPSALLLLAAFVVGGLLAPGVHRAHHGWTWAKLRGATADPCDHSQHGDGVEVPLPSFQDDLCPLCERHVEGTTPAVRAVARVRIEAPLAVRSLAEPASRPVASLLIRGPPQRA